MLLKIELEYTHDPFIMKSKSEDVTTEARYERTQSHGQAHESMLILILLLFFLATALSSIEDAAS
jgi:hypothetical protein